ncbi:MAG: kelch repeat-containing protein [Burkholderiales bacterium]|nr:kelch repeat-containing protein [Burkholderiales bacterium]
MKKFFIYTLSIFLLSCSNAGGSNQNNSPVTVGTLPNGSVVYVSQGTFSAANGSSTSGSIYINGGTPGYTFEISTAVSPSGPEITTTPTSCLLTSGGDGVSSCQINFNPNNSPQASYNVTLFYQQQSLLSLRANEVKGTGTQLPGILQFLVTSTPSPVAGNLAISLAKSNILIGESTDATITLSGSSDITTPVNIAITSENPSVAEIKDSTCNLTTANNLCTIKVVGISVGNTNIKALANGYTSVQNPIKVNNDTGNFIWMSGSKLPNSNGNYGVKGIESIDNLPPPRNRANSWVDKDGNFWLFGGEVTVDNQYNDLWKYDKDSHLWAWMSGESILNQKGIYGTKGVAASGNQPGSRIAAVTWSDESGNLWLFGGDGYSENEPYNGYLNDLWKYNINTNQWTWVAGAKIKDQAGVPGLKGAVSANNYPSARRMAVSIQTESKVWMFGGTGRPGDANNSGQLNDLWNYNINTGEWVWIAGTVSRNTPGVYGTKRSSNPANQPGARNGAVAWYEQNGNIWLFGGQGLGENNDNGFLNDLWQYNLENNQWTWVSGESTTSYNAPPTGNYGSKGISSTSNQPGARYVAVSWVDKNNNLLMLGGYGMAIESGARSGGFLNDIWQFDLNSYEWVWMDGDDVTNQPGVYGVKGKASSSNIIGARSGSVIFKGAGGGDSWIFGGNGYAESTTPGVLNDLWQIVTPE